MPWVRFLADMDWKPRPSVTIAFKAGDTKNVPRAAAGAAVLAGKGRLMRKSTKDQEPVNAEA
jgi:hypothetical protein